MDTLQRLFLLVVYPVDIAVLPSVYFLAVLVVGFGFSAIWRRRTR